MIILCAPFELGRSQTTLVKPPHTDTPFLAMTENGADVRIKNDAGKNCYEVAKLPSISQKLLPHLFKNPGERVAFFVSHIVFDYHHFLPFLYFVFELHD